MVVIVDPNTGEIIDTIDPNDPSFAEKVRRYRVNGYLVVSRSGRSPQKSPPQRTFTPQTPEGPEGEVEEPQRPNWFRRARQLFLEARRRREEEQGQGQEEQQQNESSPPSETETKQYSSMEEVIESTREVGEETHLEQTQAPQVPPPDEHNFRSAMEETRKVPENPNELIASAWTSTTTSMFYNPPEPKSPSDYWIEKAISVSNPVESAFYGALSGAYGIIEGTLIDPVGGIIQTGNTIKNLITSEKTRKEFEDFIKTPYGLTSTLVGLGGLVLGGKLAKSIRTESIGEYTGVKGQVITDKGPGSFEISKVKLPDKTITTSIISVGDDVFSSKTVKTGKQTLIEFSGEKPEIKGLTISEAEKQIFSYKGKPPLVEVEEPRITGEVFKAEPGKIIVEQTGVYEPTGLTIPITAVRGKTASIIDKDIRGIVIEDPFKGRKAVNVRQGGTEITSIEGPLDKKIDRILGMDDIYRREIIVSRDVKDVFGEVKKGRSKEGQQQVGKTFLETTKNKNNTIVGPDIKNLLFEKQLEKQVSRDILGKPQPRFKSVGETDIEGIVLGSTARLFTTSIVSPVKNEGLDLGKTGGKSGQNAFFTDKTTTSVIGGHTTVTGRWREPIIDFKTIGKQGEKTGSKGATTIKTIIGPPPIVKNLVFPGTKGGLEPIKEPKTRGGTTRITPPEPKQLNPPLTNILNPPIDLGIPRSSGGTKTRTSQIVKKKLGDAKITRELLDFPINKPPRYRIERTSRRTRRGGHSKYTPRTRTKTHKHLFTWTVKYNKVSWTKAIEEVFK